jgi:hypothetical protein
MISIENIRLLKQKLPDIWNRLKDMDPELMNPSIQVCPSKKGDLTLKISQQGSESFFHSKYDPVQEAERWVEQYSQERIEKYSHVLFYGTGLGYHIQAFTEKFPHMTFSIYEINETILFYFLSHWSLRNKNLTNIFIENCKEDRVNFINKFTYSLKENVLFVPIPSYERIFSNQYNEFSKEFAEALSSKRFNINVDLAFEKLWTLNCMVNFKKTLSTPNMLLDKKRFFKDKPVVIVAAGPSLEEEIEQLRHIKENRLAYILSVGSAINALIEYGIYPDAACTYDPQFHNHKVFEKMEKMEIDSIPLIYGTSVGFETLIRYKGPMLHMITGQDTLSAFYLFEQGMSPGDIVNDAPSIAIVTLQLLSKLECSHIILVGQNLAFKNDQYYSSGIHYGPDLKIENMKESLILVEDVYGNPVYTYESFDRMRKTMEVTLSYFSDRKFINTTKGGAKISGTEFMHLDEIIKRYLTKPVVQDEWYRKKEISYDLNYVKMQKQTMDKAYNRVVKELEELNRVLLEVNNLLETNKLNKLQKLILKLDQIMAEFLDNEFYLVFLKPMNRVAWEHLTKQIDDMRKETNLRRKAIRIIQEFGGFIFVCKKDLDVIEPIFLEMQKEIMQVAEV